MCEREILSNDPMRGDALRAASKSNSIPESGHWVVSTPLRPDDFNHPLDRVAHTK